MRGMMGEVDGRPALYNEIDPFAAAWLRALVDAGHIAPGRVDERSIRELRPDDLRGPGQRHFFAGIGVWSHALRLAGWPDDLDVWTGSCPCQPFSGAGRRAGFDDDRHLWPDWFSLIRECRPSVVFGEQVASKDGLAWLDLVHADLEAAGYAVGEVDLCSASVGAPHIRQRLFFVAIADREECAVHLRERRSLAPGAATGGRGGAGVVGDPGGARGGRDAGGDARAQGSERGGGERDRDGRGDVALASGATRLVGDADDSRSQGRVVGRHGADERSPRSAGVGGALADAESGGRIEGVASHRAAPRGHGARSADGGGDGVGGGLADAGQVFGGARDQGRSGGADTRGRDEDPIHDQLRGATSGFWDPCDWIPCRDGNWRPVEPGAFPLAHGSPARVGRLRGYGNAITGPVAATFIEAAIEVIVGGGES